MQQLQAQHQRTGAPVVDHEEEEKSGLVMNDMKRLDAQYKGNENYIVELVDSTMERHQKIPEFQIAYVWSYSLYSKCLIGCLFQMMVFM